MARRIKNLVRTLVAPLCLNDTVLDRFTLAGIEFVADKSQVIYTFAPSDLRIMIEPRSSRPRFAQTPSFNLVHVSAGPSQLSPDEGRLLEHVASLIRTNDPGAVVWESTPILFLVPGVIGNPADLSVRAIDVLRRVPVLFIEPGKESITAELLAFHGVAVDGKRIVPLPDDAGEVARQLEGVVAEDEDACLFGADEGLPGVSDPGKSLLTSASRLGDRLQVRTLGGPSVLAMALLRTPLELDRFIFLGILEDDPAGVVENLIHQDTDKALILFMGADVDTVARRIAAVCLPAGREIFLACDLTCENEMLLHLRPGDSPDCLPTLARTIRSVLIVGPPPPDTNEVR